MYHQSRAMNNSKSSYLNKDFHAQKFTVLLTFSLPDYEKYVSVIDVWGEFFFFHQYSCTRKKRIMAFRLFLRIKQSRQEEYRLGKYVYQKGSHADEDDASLMRGN